MPRPHVDRVPFSIRLPKDAHEALVAEAKKRGLSMNAATEQAVREWAKP